MTIMNLFIFQYCDILICVIELSDCNYKDSLKKIISIYNITYLQYLILRQGI